MSQVVFVWLKPKTKVILIPRAEATGQGIGELNA